MTKIAPSHARLIADVTALRTQAAALVRAHRRVSYIRPESAEAILLNYVSWALEHAELLHSIAARGEGSLVLDSVRASNGYSSPTLALRPPPAKIVSLDEYRERRRAAGA